VGTRGSRGVIGRRLGTFFRDREELPAADDLSALVREALADSEALIVICSPAAARSRWVNAEIEAFRELGRRGHIYAFVVAGVPGTEASLENCFSPALIPRDPTGHVQEPMAADARPEGDGRDRAFTKLVAGILGLGYDVLARREAQRRIRAITGVAVLSLIGMVLALGLATVAYLARNDATRRQARAEDILGFMVGDLRRKLTTVGRLDLMRSLDDKATVYYATLNPRDLTDRALEEQARLLTGIGEVRTEEGQQDAALSAFQEAHARSKALYDREPNNGQRLFDLAQAEYWIGWVAFKQARYEDAGLWLRKYRDSAIRLAAMDPGNFAWQKEVAYGDQNLAILDERLGRYAAAEQGIQQQLALYGKWLRDRPNDVALRYEATNAASWLGTLSLRRGNLPQAQEYMTETVSGLNQNIAAEPANKQWLYDVVDAYLLLADVQSQVGERSVARANVDKAHSAALALTAQDPANNQWRLALGASIWRQAMLPNTPAEATELARLAVQTLEAARLVEPKNEGIIRYLAHAWNTAANLAVARGDTTAAKRYLAETFAVLQPLWDRTHNEDLRLLLAQTWLASGDAAARDGDPESARSSWMHARDLLQEPGDVNAPLPFSRLYCLVLATYRLGDAAAEPYRKRLDDAGFVPPEPYANDATRAMVKTRVEGMQRTTSVP
jgi:tetratricopeptide (TPR) repeat protein